MAKIGREARKKIGKNPKLATVNELKSLFEVGDGIVFMNNNGITLKQATAFRKQLRDKKVAVKVAKNTLIKIALKESGIEIGDFESKFVGPTVVAVGLEDPITPAKSILNYLKDNETVPLEVKGGILKSEGKILDAAGVEQLSKLPGREEMIAMLLGSLNAPAQNLCYAMNNSVAKFAWALQALTTKLEAEAA
ncbi:MAG: 50S ribosomal protein L10 [Sumerlaeia bacterium]